MSATREVTIWCDGVLPDGTRCPSWSYGTEHPRSTAKQARASIRKLGWRRVGSRDLCSSCVEELRR